MNYNFFDISPRIVRAGQDARIVIQARYEQRFFNDGEFVLRYCPCDHVFPADGHLPRWDEFRPWPAPLQKLDQQTLTTVVNFPSEGEYTFRLCCIDEGREKQIVEFAMYALDEDLFALRPYKGDIHNHSSYSECGCRDDNPRYVAAIARSCGLDFFSISDHMQRMPSEIARDFTGNFRTEFKLFPAQEMHMLSERIPSLICRNRFLPWNHIVAWGIERDLAREMNDNFEEYMLEVTGRAAAITAPGLSDDAKFICAGADWLCDKIHELGGMAVFCHPFWKPCGRYNLPEAVREYILNGHKWDVIELIGCVDTTQQETTCIWQCNAWWVEASIRAGKMLPVIGITDTHNVEDNIRGKYYTLVFAPNSSYNALRTSMSNGLALAARQQPDGSCIFIGPSRLVNFGYFLASEYFREHDDICRIEGGMMRDYLNGGCTASSISEYADGRITRLQQKFWQQ